MTLYDVVYSHKAYLLLVFLLPQPLFHSHSPSSLLPPPRLLLFIHHFLDTSYTWSAESDYV